MFKTKKERLSMLTHRPCSVCHGTGKYYNDKYEVNNCEECKGEGYVKKTPITI